MKQFYAIRIYNQRQNNELEKNRHVSFLIHTYTFRKSTITEIYDLYFKLSNN
jgi:hypothetical protein